MEEGSNDHTQDPATPAIPLKSPNKEDESPSKITKTGTPVDSTTNQANIGKIVHNPYRKSAPKKSTNNNFGNIASSKVSTEKRRKKPTSLKAYLRVQLPTVVENVQQWSQVTVETIELLHKVWKALCEVDSQNSAIEPWNEGPNSRTKHL